MKVSTASLLTLYSMNMTCTDNPSYAYSMLVRLSVGPNTTIQKYKASFLLYDKYELEINKNMNIVTGFVEYQNGTTKDQINIPSNYAIIYGLSSFTF